MKLFVWDFHGVLEKGNDFAVLEITNKALRESGYSRQMTQDEAEMLSGKRWHEYFAFLLPERDAKIYLQLQSLCFEISQNHPEIILQYIQLNDHADYVLQSIKSLGYQQILLSNTPPKPLDAFVKFVGIEDYFQPTHRFGADSHNQQKLTKKNYLEQFLVGKHFPKGIVSIGDSPSDMALIHGYELGVGYLYTHPGRKHRETECHYRIHDLRLVLQEITKKKTPEYIKRKGAKAQR